MESYVPAPLPVPAFPVDKSGGWTGWGMLGNGPDPTLTITTPNGLGAPVGDCGFCGCVHKVMADVAMDGETGAVFPDSNQTVTSYDIYDHGQDDGVDLGQMLATWFGPGLPERLLPNPAGYVRVDHTSRESIAAALGAFGALIVGVNLTPDADQLFSQGEPWTVADGQIPDPGEGHCVVLTGMSVDADTYVTWGAEQQATVAWSEACVEECWAVLTEETATAAGVNLDGLLADIRALGGHTAPPPAPNPPAPDPAPPGPSPAPPAVLEAVVDELEDAAAAVEDLAEEVVDDLRGFAGRHPDGTPVDHAGRPYGVPFGDI